MLAWQACTLCPVLLVRQTFCAVCSWAMSGEGDAKQDQGLDSRECPGQGHRCTIRHEIHKVSKCACSWSRARNR